MDRRQFVKLAGIASVATTGALAGCQGGGNGTENGDNGNGSVGGSSAGYNTWLTEDADSSGSVTAISLDADALSELQSDDQTTSENNEQVQQDALASTPISYLLAASLAVGFGTADLGLSNVSGENSSAETQHVLSGGFVFEGSFDTDEIGSSVQSAVGGEPTEYGGYTLYEQSESGSSRTVAISEDTIVASTTNSDSVTDPASRARAIIDTGNGDADSYSDTEPPFNQLSTALPSQMIMGTAYSPDGGALESSSEDSFGDFTTIGDTDLSGNALGVAASADFSSESLTPSVAIRYESESEVDDRSTIESALGSQASNRTVSIDGPLVVVSGEYSAQPSG